MASAALVAVPGEGISWDEVHFLGQSIAKAHGLRHIMGQEVPVLFARMP